MTLLHISRMNLIELHMYNKQITSTICLECVGSALMTPLHTCMCTCKCFIGGCKCFIGGGTVYAYTSVKNPQVELNEQYSEEFQIFKISNTEPQMNLPLTSRSKTIKTSSVARITHVYRRTCNLHHHMRTTDTQLQQ